MNVILEAKDIVKTYGYEDNKFMQLIILIYK